MNNVSEHAIEVTSVCKTYISGESSLQVLQEIDFKLKRGESAIILGKSGSGKSTFLHLIGGLDTIDSGQIVVADSPLHAMKEKELEAFRRNHIGFIFQSHYLLNDFTVLENVYLPALMCGRPKKESIEFSKHLIEQVGLSDRLHHYPKKISGGEKQRIAVARALVTNPDIILADEPTGNLDEYNSKIVEDILFELVEDYQRSLVLVTHDNSLRSRGTAAYRLFLGKLEEY
jgi:lipoprotein-releasing system ATP-binding protein